MRVWSVFCTAACVGMLLVAGIAPAVADDALTADGVRSAIDEVEQARTDLEAECLAKSMDKTDARRLESSLNRVARELEAANRRLDDGDLEAAATSVARATKRLTKARTALDEARPARGAQ